MCTTFSIHQHVLQYGLAGAAIFNPVRPSEESCHLHVHMYVYDNYDRQYLRDFLACSRFPYNHVL